MASPIKTIANATSACSSCGILLSKTQPSRYDQHALNEKQNYPTRHSQAVDNNQRDNLPCYLASVDGPSMQIKLLESHKCEQQQRTGGYDVEETV